MQSLKLGSEAAFASQDQIQTAIDPQHPEFYRLFAETNRKSPVQSSALKALGKLAANQRATMPLFEGACTAYTILVTSGIETALDPVNRNRVDLRQKKSVFLNLFKASQNESLSQAIRDDLRRAIKKLSNQGAFICFDLRGLDLNGLNLSRINLAGANLYGVNLSNTDLSFSLLSRAILTNANLTGAILNCANFYNADLSGANFFKADLTITDLKCANLSGTNLSSADLSGADLCEANLFNANLSNTNLSGANMFSVNLSEAYEIDSDGERAKLNNAFIKNTNKNEGEICIVS